MESAMAAEAPAQGQSFEDVVARLRAERDAKVDVVLNTRDHVEMVVPAEQGQPRTEIEFDTPDYPELDGLSMHATDWAHRGIAGRSHIPWNYYDRLRGDYPVLLARNVNTLWNGEPENRLVRTLQNGDRRVRAWLSDRFRVLDNLPFVQTVLGVATEHGAEIHTCNVSDERLYIKLVTPQQREVRAGDAVQAGIVIRNSEVGDGRVSIRPFVLRLVCTNGMVSTTGYAKVHLGSQLDEGIMSYDTLRKENEAVWAKVRDWTKYALAPDNLEEIVEQLQRADRNRLQVAAKHAVANVVRSTSLSQGEGDRVLEHYLRNAHRDGESQFGIVNAVTRAAQDAGSYRRATELEEEGGKLLSRDPAEFVRMASRPLSDKEIAGAFTDA